MYEVRFLIKKTTLSKRTILGTKNFINRFFFVDLSSLDLDALSVALYLYPLQGRPHGVVLLENGDLVPLLE